MAAAAREAVDAMQRWVLPHQLRIARRVSAALVRLEQATSAAEVFRAAPGELGAAGHFDRVLVSTVRDSDWSPETWWARDAERPQDRAIVESLKGSTVTLAGGMVEAEIVRRRAAALVRDTGAELRTWAPFTDVAESRAYLVAPVVTADRVVGLLHADAGLSGRPLGEADLTAVRAFADGIGLILERLALRDRIDLQGRQIRAALAAAADAVAAADEATVKLPPLGAVAPAYAPATAGPTALPAARNRIEEKLTARERDVFGLLVSGATNAQIADRLTVSETTVKSHVQHILRKLRVANRAEAIAQYLRSGAGSAAR